MLDDFSNGRQRELCRRLSPGCSALRQSWARHQVSEQGPACAIEDSLLQPVRLTLRQIEPAAVFVREPSRRRRKGRMPCADIPCDELISLAATTAAE
jgi:hypothetical protein